MIIRKGGNMYNFRQATKEDFDQTMVIINKGKAFLKEQGVDQWQGNNPNDEIIRDDIEKGYTYVLEKDGKILGTAALCFDGEPGYENMIEGQWLTNGEFLVIHRMAVDYELKGSGLAAKIFSGADELALERGIHSIKIDTHEGNKPMQKAVLKDGYKYCGKIFYDNGDGERLAYEKVI